MSDLKDINSKLEQVCRLLDQTASEINSSSLPYPSVDIESIGKALAHIFDVQHSVYSVCPELTPDHLLENSRFPDANKQFGKLLSQNERLLADNNPQEAIALINDFISSEPPAQFVSMAKGQIERIRTVFKLSLIHI